MKLENQVTSLELMKWEDRFDEMFIDVKDKVKAFIQQAIEEESEAIIKDILDASFAFVEDCEAHGFVESSYSFGRIS